MRDFFRIPGMIPFTSFVLHEIPCFTQSNETRVRASRSFEQRVYHWWTNLGLETGGRGTDEEDEASQAESISQMSPPPTKEQSRKGR